MSKNIIVSGVKLVPRIVIKELYVELIYDIEECNFSLETDKKSLYCVSYMCRKKLIEQFRTKNLLNFAIEFGKITPNTNTLVEVTQFHYYHVNLETFREKYNVSLQFPTIDEKSLQRINNRLNEIYEKITKTNLAIDISGLSNNIHRFSKEISKTIEKILRASFGSQYYSKICNTIEPFSNELGLVNYEMEEKMFQIEILYKLLEIYSRFYDSLKRVIDNSGIVELEILKNKRLQLFPEL